MDGYDKDTGEVLAAPAIAERSAGASLPRMPVEVATAILKVMRAAKQLGYDENNQHASYRYVSIDKFLETFRPLMAEAGLLFVVDEVGIDYRDGAPGRDGKVTAWAMPRYEAWLYTETGAAWGPLRRHLALPMTGPQTFGAAESYVQKRLLRALFMVATGDKDADDTEQQNAPVARASRHTPAQQAPSARASLARAAVQRIRAEIAKATYIEQLNASGINGPSREHDEILIKEQAGGSAVWDDLIERDAAKRVSLSEESVGRDPVEYLGA